MNDSVYAEFANVDKIIARVRAILMPPEHLRIPEMEYAEKYVKIKTEDMLVIPFRINPVQRIYYDIKARTPMPKATGKRFIVLKARRMGITTIEQCISYAQCRTRRNSKCMTIAQTKPDTAKIFEMVLRMHQDDPNFAKLDKDRKDALAYKLMRSDFSIGTAGGVAVARGDTLSRVHGSEVAFWDTNDNDTDNLIASLGEAARRGEMVLESTANGLGGWYYEKWQEAKSGDSIWTPIFLGWYMDSRNQVSVTKEESDIIVDTITDEESHLVDQFGCNINQIAWRREKSKGKAKAKKMFKQEYPSTPEEAFISTGTSYFNTDIIEKKERECKQPIRESEGLCIWAEPIEGIHYIVAADTSEGNLNSDDSPIGVLRWDNGEQVARLNWKASPSALGHKCVEFAKKYNGALIAIENNNTGHSAINTVMNQCLYNRVYYHEDLVKENPKESTTPGWRTTGLTRPLLLNELNDSLENDEMIVNDKLFLTQCRVFRDNGQGKSEASRNSGHHGDLVITWGIAWQARKAKWKLSLEPIFV